MPSNANPEDLRPSDIPSEQVLKQMGLSNAEISEAMDYKFSKGKYAKGFKIQLRIILIFQNFMKVLGTL